MRLPFGCHALALLFVAGCSASEAQKADDGAFANADPGPDPVDEVGGAWAPPVESGAVAFPYKPYRCGYSIAKTSPTNAAATFDAPAAGTAPAPLNLHLTITGNAATSVVVQWSTDPGTLGSEVRFGDAPGGLDRVAHGYSFVAGTRRQHEVHLCGLSPGRTFYYDAGGMAGRSTVHPVTTAPDGPGDITILAGGDARSNPAIWGRAVQAARGYGPTMFLFSGDAVLSGGSQSDWDKLFAAAPDFFAEVPGLWAHGNHEALDELYFQQLALPDNEQWFARTYGPLRVVVLNDTVSNAAIITTTEKTFLQTTLQSIDRGRTPFVTTLHHKPLYTTSQGHASDATLRGVWGPIFAQFQVDFDIAGHVHSYESTLPIKSGTLATAGAGEFGTRFFNFGGGGAGLYSFNATQPWIQKRESTNGCAILKVSAHAATWIALRADGSVIETVGFQR